MSDNSHQYSPEETEQRVRKALRGAFRGSPTQLKDIPRKRSLGRAQSGTKKPRKTA